MKIVDYHIEVAPSPGGLASAVMSFIESGWALHGPPFALIGGNIAQALVRWEEDEPAP